jgi:hypothetical protein
MIEAVIPEEARNIQGKSVANEIVRVLPASRWLGVCRRGVILAEHYGDICEVVSQQSQIREHGSFIGVGAPDGLAPAVRQRYSFIA